MVSKRAALYQSDTRTKAPNTAPNGIACRRKFLSRRNLRSRLSWRCRYIKYRKNGAARRVVCRLRKAQPRKKAVITGFIPRNMEAIDRRRKKTADTWAKNQTVPVVAE